MHVLSRAFCLLCLLLTMGGSAVSAQNAASATPKNRTRFSGMELDPGWLPDRLGVARKFMESLQFFSRRVAKPGKRGNVRAPEFIYDNLRWLMPLDEAVASLGRVSKMTETKITNQAFPQNSLTVQGLQGRFQDGNSTFNLMFLVADKQRRLVSVELVSQTPRGPGWYKGAPVQEREPYYGFINVKVNASTTNMVSYQVVPVRPGVKLIKTVLHKRPPENKWLENVHWYLPAPLAMRFLDIADKVL